MRAPRVRITLVILDILDVIMDAKPDEPAWGLRICELTGHGPGTIYPALERLMKAGWIEDQWEDPAPADRPRRRLYTITSAGRAKCAEEARKHARGTVVWAPDARGMA